MSLSDAPAPYAYCVQILQIATDACSSLAYRVSMRNAEPAYSIKQSMLAYWLEGGDRLAHSRESKQTIRALSEVAVRQFPY